MTDDGLRAFASLYWRLVWGRGPGLVEPFGMPALPVMRHLIREGRRATRRGRDAAAARAGELALDMSDRYERAWLAGLSQKLSAELEREIAQLRKDET